jgi:hypothetical protein
MSGADSFIARWERLEAAYLERIAAAVAPHPTWRERFRAGAALTVELVERYPQDACFLAVDSLSAGVTGRRCRRHLATHLAALLDSVRTELPEPDLVPAATSSWIVAIFFARVYRRCTSPEGPDLPSQLPELMFLAISAYFGTEAGLQELLRGA